MWVQLILALGVSWFTLYLFRIVLCVDWWLICLRLVVMLFGCLYLEWVEINCGFCLVGFAWIVDLLCDLFSLVWVNLGCVCVLGYGWFLMVWVLLYLLLIVIKWFVCFPVLVINLVNFWMWLLSWKCVCIVVLVVFCSCFSLCVF